MGNIFVIFILCISVLAKLDVWKMNSKNVGSLKDFNVFFVKIVLLLSCNEVALHSIKK